MLKTIKKQLADKINTANENNELTTQKMYDIAYESIIHYALGEKNSSLHNVTKELITLSVQTLVKVKVSSADKIFATLQGITDGVKQAKSREINNIHNELTHAKTQLIEEEKTLATSLRIALNGVQEASENFTGSIRDDIEAALADTKLKNTELLGLTKDTVKQAIFCAIETSTQLENDIIIITCRATTKALAESCFNAEGISKVTENILLAAVEAAEELDKYVLLTASAATEGVYQGLRKTVDVTHENIDNMENNFEQIQKDFELVGSLFTETLHKVARKSGKPAKEILHELAHDAEKAGSTLREKAVLATQTVANRIDNPGEKLPDKTEPMTKESKVLDQHMENFSIDAYKPKEIADRIEQVSISKSTLDPSKVFALAILAGAFIALAAVFYTLVIHESTMSPGITRLLGGFVFSLGLVLVLIAGAELFTGNNLLVMACVDNKITFKQLMINWSLVFFGNLVGSLAIVLLIYLSDHWLISDGKVGSKAIMIANSKVNLSFMVAFSRGILCNILVCMAVWMCFACHSVADKILVIIFPIAGFVAMGFEHSVANMYFIPAGIVAHLNTDITQMINPSVDLSNLNLSGFMINLLPVTLGNIVGGSVFVGLTYWFIYLRD